MNSRRWVVGRMTTGTLNDTSTRHRLRALGELALADKSPVGVPAASAAAAMDGGVIRPAVFPRCQCSVKALPLTTRLPGIGAPATQRRRWSLGAELNSRDLREGSHTIRAGPVHP